MTLLPQSAPPQSKRWALFAHHLGDYMRRWILRTPWGSLRLHRILRSDDDRHLHDHPFDFTSFLISGGYSEVTAAGLRWWPRFSLVRKMAEDAHAVSLTKPVWTFVIAGPKRRDWGLHTEKGWCHHANYARDWPTHAESTARIEARR